MRDNRRDAAETVRSVFK